MDFALTHTQKMLIDTVRRFIEEELKPLEASVDAENALAPETARAIFEKSRALGLYALNMPDEFGGGGLSAVDTMLCEEQFGHTSDILIRRAFGDVFDALLACKGEQIDRWLRPVVSGERVCALAITEPSAGSDARAVRTRAQRTDSGWVLNGSKHFISDAECSDCFLVLARTGEKELSLFLVDKGLPGFTLGKNQEMMGLRGTTHNELFFDDVPLEPVALVGEQGEGFKIIMELLGRVRLALIGARAVGKAAQVLEMMTQYANDRKQFGRSIGEFQMIQQMLADSVIEINSARLMVLHTAWMLDNGLDARDWISMVKVQSAEMLGRVVDRGVQIFGGSGFCKDLAIERYYRDARIFRIFDGTSEIHRMSVAKSLLRNGAPLFDIHR
jgi:acyl-CoA dehydrogenase